MQDFVFHNPTRIVFGTGVVDQVGKECARYGRKALILAGQGSARTSGLLDRITERLREADVGFVILEGVQPNPRLSHARKAVTLAKAERVDMLLAVGGGSVIDEAKAVCSGALVDHDVWEFYKGRLPERSLPLLTVLTLAATGSEMNGGSILSNEETKEKLPFRNPLSFPRVSIMEPELTLSVSPWQTACGLSDAFAHLMEIYCNSPDPRPLLQMEFIEGLVRTIHDCARRLMQNLQDLDARREFMWAATLALNGLTAAGSGPTPWPLHMMEHALSGITDVSHGAGLSALYPGWMRWRLQNRGERLEYRLARLGRKCFGVSEQQNTAAALACITAIEEWYHSIGAPASLDEAGIAASDDAEVIQAAARDAVDWGLHEYNAKALSEIFSAARPGKGSL